MDCSRVLEICETFVQSKQARTQFLNSENKAANLFELVHCDIWGPDIIPASCGEHYFLTLIDDASHALWLYLMKEKSEAGHFLKFFVSMAKNQFGKVVKVIRTNNGLEFK